MHSKYTNKTLQLFLPFISQNFYTKRRQKWDKKIVEDKTLHTQNTNLRQSWKFYTTTGGDGGDI